MRITISIPDDLYNALVEQAGTDDRSMSYVVRDALKKTLPEVSTNGAVPKKTAVKSASVRKKVTEAKKATAKATPKATTTKPVPKAAAVRKRAAAKAKATT
jgi:metal-responsive CopG/Arc/MetJ family transcriptional regulator